MRSSAWLRSHPRRPRRGRLDKNRELLGSRDRIDIELGHSFDPHLVTKSRMKHDRSRVIGDLRAISVVGIHLFPNAAIFKPYYGMALDAVNVAIHATNEGVEFGSRVLICFFGGLYSGFLDLLARFGLRLLGRFLLSALAITLQVSIQMLELVLAQFIQTRGLELLRSHRFLDAPGRFFRSGFLLSAFPRSRLRGRRWRFLHIHSLLRAQSAYGEE